MKALIALFAFAGCIALSFKTSAQPGIRVIEKSYIFENAPFESCHASTIVELRKGRLMAAWFGGKHEGSNDVAIWAAFRENSKWSAPLKIADGVQEDRRSFPCWNPVLFRAASGILYLHYKVGPNPREWWALYKVSFNEGKDWSDPVKLPQGFLGPIKNKPVQLKTGAILYPSSTESPDEKIWKIHMEISDRAVKEWQKVDIDCDTFQTIQPSVLVYPGGKLQLLARSRQNVVVESWSENGGRSWSQVQTTALPNPNSGSDAVSLPGGTQLLVYNPLTAGKNWWEGRSVLKLAASSDGRTWKDIHVFEQEAEGEYSYPAIIANQGGDIFITYTDRRRKISFVHLRPEPSRPGRK